MHILDATVEQSGDAVVEIAIAGDEQVVYAVGGGSPSLLANVVLETDLEVERYVEHGWQSWSTARVRRADDIDARRAEAPRWLRDEMLIEGGLAGSVGAADLMLVHEGGVEGSLRPSSLPLSFRVASDGSVAVSVDAGGVLLEPGERRELARIASFEGDPGAALSNWAEHAAGGDARAPRPQPFGWCSWYQYFTKVTAADVEANLTLAAAHGLELVQVDDGWQRSIGEWTATSTRFGRPIEQVATRIREEGLSAGIWTAPFLAMDGGPLAQEHPEWLLRDEQGRPRRVMFHGDWGGWVLALDTTRPDVLEHLGESFRWLRAAGFDYFKIDFLYAAAMPGIRSDPTIPRTEALRAGIAAIREAIGEESYLLGCGCPLGPAIGLVDAMRVSEDVAPFWEPRLHFPGWPECSVATANAVEQSIRRAPLHRRFFANDPDCALLRPTDTELSPRERRTLADLVIGTGGFSMVSDDLSLYGTKEWDVLGELGALRTLVDGPLDLVDPLAEQELELRGLRHGLSVDLAARSSSLHLP